MDPVGWYIATLHSLLGHAKTAAYIGAEAGDQQHCLICQYERYPGPGDPRYDISGIPVDFAQQRELRRQAVIEAIRRRHR